jgi:hypothetical protein
MSVKYQVRKVRRDGVSQRYWVNPSREHDDAVTAVVRGRLATAESHKMQELARQIMQSPSVQELLYRSLVRQYEETKSSDAQPMLFLRHYLSRGYPEVESLLVRLATEPSSRYVRTAAIETMATSINPRVPRLLREIADKAPDEDTARSAILHLSRHFNNTMQNLLTEGIAPSRDAVLDALDTLGLAMQGKWFEPKSEIGSILVALNYKRSDFEQAAQGQIPASVEKQVIDGLMSVLSMGSLSTNEFMNALNVVKRWESAYSLPKLRSLLNGSLPQHGRAMVIDAINEIEDHLKRKSG